MPEAEDVLLEAAERATHWVRVAWERRRGASARDEPSSTNAAQRRLATWQTAWLGRSWPIAPAAARPAPGPLARRIRRLPPWTAQQGEAPFTDGGQIWLPRHWLEGAREEAQPDRGLLATLGLARRLARGSVPGSAPGGRLARDLAWLAEGALGDAALTRAWPGLAPALHALRREAIAMRPHLARLRPAEREVESWLRALLETPPDRLPPSLADGLDPESAPGDVSAFATERARAMGNAPGGYRGCAPVAHWGVDHPAGVEPTDAAGRATSGGSRPRRSARLQRPLGRRAPEPDPERPGPFVLPFADPQLTVDDPGGRVRPPDRGHDEDLETLAEEMGRLEDLTVVRHDVPVRETLEDGGAPASTHPASTAVGSDRGGPVWLYPEWDAGRVAYRNPGCRVRELPPAEDDAGWAERALAARRVLLVRLRRQLEGFRPRRQRLRRQPDGDDVDLAGWVDDWTNRRAGRTPEGRVYTQERPRRREVAVTLLLDASGSTESWLSGRQRVIDVVKEAALAFGEALATVGDRFAMLAFSGQGAADVRVRVLKRFREAPGPTVQRRIGALEPDAFTRLGGALRHATAGLAREHARARLLLVLSDGKPQDEDGYEGRYGIEDVRQAVAEARLQGVRVFGITVDREGPTYLPRLFGAHRYTVIWNAEALPERLPAIYRRLTAGA
jgi:nitric oxide reductase NorD protein